MAASDSIVCPSCGKKYRVKPEMAGKRVKCGCGAAIQVPAAASAKDDGGFMLDMLDEAAARSTKADSQRAASRAQDKPAKAAAKTCPSCKATVSPGAAICIQCGTNLKTGAKVQPVLADKGDETAAPANAKWKVWAIGGGSAAALILLLVILNPFGGGGTPAPSPVTPKNVPPTGTGLATGPTNAPDPNKDRGAPTVPPLTPGTNPEPITPEPPQPPKPPLFVPPAQGPVVDWVMPASKQTFTPQASRPREIIAYVLQNIVDNQGDVANAAMAAGLLARMGDGDGYETLIQGAAYNFARKQHEGVSAVTLARDVNVLALARRIANDHEGYRESIATALAQAAVTANEDRGMSGFKRILLTQLIVGDYDGARATVARSEEVINALPSIKDLPKAAFTIESGDAWKLDLSAVVKRVEGLGEGHRLAGFLDVRKALLTSMQFRQRDEIYTFVNLSEEIHSYGGALKAACELGNLEFVENEFYRQWGSKPDPVVGLEQLPVMLLIEYRSRAGLITDALRWMERMPQGALSPIQVENVVRRVMQHRRGGDLTELRKAITHLGAARAHVWEAMIQRQYKPIDEIVKELQEKASNSRKMLPSIRDPAERQRRQNLVRDIDSELSRLPLYTACLWAEFGQKELGMDLLLAHARAAIKATLKPAQLDVIATGLVRARRYDEYSELLAKCKQSNWTGVATHGQVYDLLDAGKDQLAAEAIVRGAFTPAVFIRHSINNGKLDAAFTLLKVNSKDTPELGLRIAERMLDVVDADDVKKGKPPSFRVPQRQ
ncbi:MAG: hypothetical protein WD768_10690 [Phycisphaeraceae bacterium]